MPSMCHSSLYVAFSNAIFHLVYQQLQNNASFALAMTLR